MRDGWIIYAAFGVLLCLLLWRVATQWNVNGAEAGNLRASLQFWASLRLLLSFGRACGSSVLEQQPLIRKPKPSRCLPPPRLRTHSMMLIQLLQSKVYQSRRQLWSKFGAGQAD